MRSSSSTRSMNLIRTVRSSRPSTLRMSVLRSTTGPPKVLPRLFHNTKEASPQPASSAQSPARAGDWAEDAGWGEASFVLWNNLGKTFGGPVVDRRTDILSVEGREERTVRIKFIDLVEDDDRINRG